MQLHDALSEGAQIRAKNRPHFAKLALTKTPNSNTNDESAATDDAVVTGKMNDDASYGL